MTSDCPLPDCTLSHSDEAVIDALRRRLPPGTVDLAVGLIAAFLTGATAAWPAPLPQTAAEVLRHADALGTFGGLGSVRPPRNDGARAAMVRWLTPERARLASAAAADPEDLWSRLQLGLLWHCEGTARAADALDAAADRLAAQGLAPNLVADLRFHAGLARLRRLEGAGEADGDGS